MFYLRKQHIYRNESEGEGDAGGGDRVEVAPEVEEKARKMGWTPKEEFKGDPEKWRGAAEFVERGETMLPIMRKTVEKLERKLAETEKTMKEFAEFHTKTEQRAYEKAYRELKEQQIKAVSAGDAAAFMEADKELATLQQEAATKAKPQSGAHPDYAAWVEKNRWVEDDPELAEEAEVQALYLRNKGTKLEGADFLNEVAKRVKERRPEKFGNPRRSAAPSVEGSTPGPRKAGGKTFADMPKDARDACVTFESRFGIKRDEYVKNYFEGQ